MDLFYNQNARKTWNEIHQAVRWLNRRKHEKAFAIGTATAFNMTNALTNISLKN